MTVNLRAQAGTYWIACMAADASCIKMSIGTNHAARTLPFHCNLSAQ
jgi:hypothetical protein